MSDEKRLQVARRQMEEKAGGPSRRVDPEWVKLTEKEGEPFVGCLLYRREQGFAVGKRMVYTFETLTGDRVRIPGQTNLDEVLAAVPTGAWVTLVFRGYEPTAGGQRVGRWEVYAVDRGASLDNDTAGTSEA